MRAFWASAIIVIAIAFPVLAKDVHSQHLNNQGKIQNSGTKPQNPAPQPIFVNVVAPEKNASEKEQDAKDRAEKADNDRKLVEFTRQLANYTFGLFAATIALVVATGVMACLGWRQAREMKVSLAIAKESADAAMLQAKTLIGVEQPIIFAGNFQISPANTGTAMYAEGLPEVPVVSVRFHNYGRTPAEMIGYRIVPKIVGKLPDKRDDFEIFPVAPGTVIKPDDWRAFPFVFQWSEGEQSDIINGETRLWIYGCIAYKDFLGNRHEVGFCSMAIPAQNSVLKFVFGGDTPSAYVYHKSF